MTPQELKNSILQLAIQGKLVEQRPEEGTAEELYTQIHAEKQKLIEAEKIKKEKPLPEITEDEIPFDIPDSWEWVRLGETIRLTSGQDLENKYYNSAQNGIPYITGASNIKDGVVLINRWTEYPKSKAYKGNLLITCKGTIGAMAFLQEPIAHIARQIMSIATYSNNVCLNFVKIVLETYVANLRQNARSMIPGISRDMILRMPIPLPPLAEQKRIVAKIEELLPLIDRYEKAWTKLEDLNKRFPDDLQKSLLQLAIQGKLVEQRQEEGTAEELYTQIQAEKQKLIEAGKIKKEKPLPEITDNEIPFDIPDSWKWVRLFDICSLISDGTHKTPTYVESGVPFLSVKDISSGVLDFSNTRFISEKEHFELTQRCLPEKNDILICRIGTLGKALKIDVEKKFSIFVSLGLIKLINHNVADYIVLTINSGYGFSWIQKVKVGGGTQTFKINLNDLRLMSLPLPPLTEQKRIVEKLEEILPLCERLK